MIYYFTYGASPTQPYIGGWTEVEANSRYDASQLFCAVHPRTASGWINCASIYSEEELRATRMLAEGNRGRRCVERIRLEVDVLDRSAKNLKGGKK